MIGTPPLPPWFHGLLPDLRVPVSHGWVEGVCLFERRRLTESGVWWLRFFWPIKIQWEETIDCNWSLRSPCYQYGISALVSQTSFGGKPPVSSRNVRCFLRLWNDLVCRAMFMHCRLLLSKKYLSVPFSYIHTYKHTLLFPPSQRGFSGTIIIYEHYVN